MTNYTTITCEKSVNMAPISLYNLVAANGLIDVMARELADAAAER